MSFSLTTKAFTSAGDIPRQFTCEGQDISPALEWSGAPTGTRAFALIADDPDAPAGTWTHWVLFDLPASSNHLPEGVAKTSDVPGGGHQGRNDFGKTGYGGPCPPPGKPHRYFFKLYALDGPLNLKGGASRAEVEGAMKGHTLGETQVMGKYKR